MQLERKRAELSAAENQVSRAQDELVSARGRLANAREAWEAAGCPRVDEAAAKAASDQQLSLIGQCVAADRAALRARLRSWHFGVASVLQQLRERWGLPSPIVPLFIGVAVFAFVAVLALAVTRSPFTILGAATTAGVGVFAALAWLEWPSSACDIGKELASCRARLAHLATARADVKAQIDGCKRLLNGREVQRAYEAAEGAVHEAEAKAKTCGTECRARQAELAALREQFSERNQLLLSDWRGFKAVEFENFLTRVFVRLGYAVQTTPVTGDQGIDLMLTKGGVRLAIQAKGYPNSTVGNSAVQEAYAGMRFYKCSRCAVVTNSTFTASARQLTASVECLLISAAQMEDLIDVGVTQLTGFRTVVRGPD